MNLLSICSEHSIAVVPFGGGTSVVGGVEPLRDGFGAVVAVDMLRMDRLLHLDKTSLLATFEPGIRGPAAEALLAAEGLTLGHFPQSYERASIGGYAATRSAGQASTGYGRIDEMVVALRCATPVGELRIGVPPASAAGPDLRQLLVGSEGALGVLTEVTLHVRKAPAVQRYEAWFFRDFAAGLETLRALAQDGASPDVVRLSDEEETRAALAMAGGGVRARIGARYLSMRGYRDGCLTVLGWEGSADGVRVRRRSARKVLRSAGGLPNGLSRLRAAKAALQERLALRRGPQLRGAPRRILLAALRDRPAPAVGCVARPGRAGGPRRRRSQALPARGVLAETLETATTWTRIATLHQSVAAALRNALGGPVLVGCHVSHLYAIGASLYFTVLAPAGPGDEIERWHRAKKAATEALLAGGGTLTHHHAVGADHCGWLADEIGPLGVDVLHAVKGQLDPAGILNPGKLLQSGRHRA